MPDDLDSALFMVHYEHESSDKKIKELWDMKKRWNDDLPENPPPRKKKTWDGHGYTENYRIPFDRTETKNESLTNSLLKYVESKNASKENLEEVFCRDIDAFNEVFQVDTIGKPAECPEVN